MTKDEIDKIESWLKFEKVEHTDEPNEYIIRFTPEIELRDHDKYGNPSEWGMRGMLAVYLKRIAAHLEA